MADELSKKINLLYEHQIGFQEDTSTEQAITDLKSNIMQAIEKNQKPVLYFQIWLKSLIQRIMRHY